MRRRDGRGMHSMHGRTRMIIAIIPYNARTGRDDGGGHSAGTRVATQQGPPTEKRLPATWYTTSDHASAAYYATVGYTATKTANQQASVIPARTAVGTVAGKVGRPCDDAVGIWLTCLWVGVVG